MAAQFWHPSPVTTRVFHNAHELGEGGFGKVFLAEQRQLANRQVVLKIAPDIRGESQTLAQLQHTHIMPIYSFHHARPVQALCMPYLGATTLADVFREVSSCGAVPDSGKVLVSTMNNRRKSTLRPGDSKQTPSGTEGPQTFVEQPAGVAPIPAEAVPKNPNQTTLALLEGMSYVQSVLWMDVRLADGLTHAHDRGILHRDPKPANILLTDDVQPMLLDFNLSEDTKLRGSAAAASIGGTLPYMSPEHLEAFRKGKRPVDARSDIYSLGVILFELLGGRTPFPVHSGRAMKGVVDRMIADRLHAPPRLRPWNKAVSPAVESIVRHCLEPEPSKRYQSAGELREDIQRHLDHLPLRFASEPSLKERAGKWMRRHPRLSSMTTVGTLAVLLVAALSAAFVARGEQLKHFRAKEVLSAFEKEVTSAQLLLYDRNADQKQLADGVARCQTALDRYKVLENPVWHKAAGVTYLGAGDKEKLNDGLCETLFLMGRANQVQAAGLTDPEQRAKHLQLAIRCNQAAETAAGAERGVRAIWEQRAELNRLAGKEADALTLLAKASKVALRVDRDYFMLGHKYAMEGNFRKALPLLQEATRQSPRNFAALNQDGFFNFVLGAQPTGSSTDAVVTMNIYNSAGSLVLSLTVSAGQPPVTTIAFLQTGTYTLRYSAHSKSGGSPASVNYWLAGQLLTDPIGPLYTDPNAPQPDPNAVPPPDYSYLTDPSIALYGVPYFF